MNIPVVQSMKKIEINERKSDITLLNDTKLQMLQVKKSQLVAKRDTSSRLLLSHSIIKRMRFAYTSR